MPCWSTAALTIHHITRIDIPHGRPLAPSLRCAGRLSDFEERNISCASTVGCSAPRPWPSAVCSLSLGTALRCGVPRRMANPFAVARRLRRAALGNSPDHEFARDLVKVKMRPDQLPVPSPDLVFRCPANPDEGVIVQLAGRRSGLIGLERVLQRSSPGRTTSGITSPSTTRRLACAARR